MPTSKRIERALPVLVGRSLRDAGRFGVTAGFHFEACEPEPGRPGAQTGESDPETAQEHILRVQCAWRIVRREEILVTAHDVYWIASDLEEEPPDFDWEPPGSNRRDERLQALFERWRGVPPVVEEVAADEVGGACLRLSGGYVLEIWPEVSFPREHWRLYASRDGGDPAGGIGRPFVVRGDDIEE